MKQTLKTDAPAILFFVVLATVLFLISVSIAFARTSNAGTKTTPTKGPGSSQQDLFYNPDIGLQYVKGDFKWTTWGFAEGVVSNKRRYWRRVRQGMEFQFPGVHLNAFEDAYRMTFAYEVDFTDNDFFRARKKSKIWENLYATVQDAVDPNRFRLLFGENTHILSREDNLSSGNLTTINRSLILEEHGSVNSFGTQFGAQFQTLVAPQTLLQLSMQDNRGSLNTDDPNYDILNDFSGKLSRIFPEDTGSETKFALGLGVDYTADIGEKDFSMLSAIDQRSLGSIPAAGHKFSVETDASVISRIFGKTDSLEAESIYSRFGNNLDAFGGYLMAQQRIFRGPNFGDMVPFIRYDFVNLANDQSNAFQQAIRTGINYNLPHTHGHINLHFEYAKNLLNGSDRVLAAGNRDFSEFAVMLRISTAPYLRF